MWGFMSRGMSWWYVMGVCHGVCTSILFRYVCLNSTFESISNEQHWNVLEMCCWSHLDIGGVCLSLSYQQLQYVSRGCQLRSSKALGNRMSAINLAVQRWSIWRRCRVHLVHPVRGCHDMSCHAFHALFVAVSSLVLVFTNQLNVLTVSLWDAS